MLTKFMCPKIPLKGPSRPDELSILQISCHRLHRSPFVNCKELAFLRGAKRTEVLVVLPSDQESRGNKHNYRTDQTYKYDLCPVGLSSSTHYESPRPVCKKSSKI